MIDPKIVAEVQAKNPGVKLALLKLKDVEVIVKYPSPAIYRKAKLRGKEKAAGDVNKDLNEEFVRDIVVYPDQAVFSKILEIHPGLTDTFANRITTELAYAAQEDKCEVVPL